MTGLSTSTVLAANKSQGLFGSLSLHSPALSVCAWQVRHCKTHERLGRGLGISSGREGLF